jgi:16S rRNA (uracil1498-N3)-methyltransferase
MNRFFIPPTQIHEQTVTFPEDLCHQILHVLRLKDGDSVKVLDNSGLVYTVRLGVDEGRKAVVGTVLDVAVSLSEPPVRVTLCCGLTQREKLEWILQKGTEVGVTDFRPFVSSRTLVQSTTLKEKRRNRWEAIIREAAEQSARGRLPRLHDPVPLQDILENNSMNVLSLVAWEEADPETGSLAQVLKGFRGDSVQLLVGPEGGLSEEEVEAAREAGWQVVSLGPRILRMETAAILFPALVLHEL